MLKGYNSDVTLEGSHYHIQTEDWGETNPFLVSHVFKNGAVIKRVKTAYSEVLPPQALKQESSIRLAMKLQHESILDLLVSGQVLR